MGTSTAPHRITVDQDDNPTDDSPQDSNRQEDEQIPDEREMTGERDDSPPLMQKVLTQIKIH